MTVFCRFSLDVSKKVCYEVALCENCQRQSCKAFTALSIRAQTSIRVVGGLDIPLNANFVREVKHPLAQRRCILWHFSRCLLTGETNCNSNLQQCCLNTENNIDILSIKLTLYTFPYSFSGYVQLKFNSELS